MERQFVLLKVDSKLGKRRGKSSWLGKDCYDMKSLWMYNTISMVYRSVFDGMEFGS